MYMINQNLSYSQLQKRIKAIPLNETELCLRGVLSPLTSTEIKLIFKRIPKQIKSLNLISNNLGKRATEELEKMLQALPLSVNKLGLAHNALYENNLTRVFTALAPTLHSLDLEDNYLFHQTTKELQAAFKALPSGLRSLSLKNNNASRHYEPNPKKNFRQSASYFIFAHSKQDKHLDLQKIFNALPQALCCLNLAKNELGTSSTENLAEALKSLPSSLLSLNLSQNSLRKNEIKLDEILKILPPHLKLLDLEGNDLFENSSAEKFAIILKALPSSLTILNLNDEQGLSPGSIEFKNFPDLHSLGLADNRLAENFNPIELEELIKNLPSSLLSLNLVCNNLGKIPALPKIMEGLPTSLKALNLSMNDFNNKTAQELEAAFQNLPKSLEVLYLFGNELSKIQCPINNIFKHLPPSLKILDLGCNALTKKSTDELIGLFKSLPASLRRLNLYGNDLTEKPTEELVILFKALPKSLQVLNLSCNNLSKKTKSELALLFRALPAHLKSISFSDSFSKNQLQGIEQGLKTQRSLTKIDWFFDPFEGKNIYKLLARNLKSPQPKSKQVLKKYFFTHLFKPSLSKSKTDQKPEAQINYANYQTECSNPL